MRRDGRPVFLNLYQIRLPLPGVVSFAHRISGILLVLTIPLVLWLLMSSLHDAEGYASVQAFLHHPLSAVLLLAVFWSFWHHLLSGIRFLLMDIDKGLDKQVSQRSAAVVLVAGVVAALFSLGGMLL